MSLSEPASTSNNPGPRPAAYDQTPYPCSPYPQSHPGRLCAIGMLFGMRPPAVGRGRILELGCADGSNLIPLAMEFPGAQLLGIDFSPRQVASGREMIGRLGLSNMELQCRDIAELGDELGRFDYIIAHGVFSWVPREMQERVLALCDQLLTDQGIAYISYNTYPGWHMRGMLREMALYHTRQVADPSQHPAQARAMVQFVAEAVPKVNHPFGMFIHSELQRMQTWDDGYLRHDLLEEVNEPIYFHQFVERARRHQLGYLGDAEFHTMTGHDLPARTMDTLRQLAPDLVRTEQYLDFVRNRLFRRTLLCREGVALDRRVTGTRLPGLWASAPLQPEPAGGSSPGEPAPGYRHPMAGTIRVGSRLVCAALDRLGRIWPEAIEVSQLFAAASRQIGSADASNPFNSAEAMNNTLLECFSRGLVELSACPSACVSRPGPRPTASPLARIQAERSLLITTLRHAVVQLEPAQAYLLRLLDGTLDRQQLLERLIQAATTGALTIREGQTPIQDRERLTPVLDRVLESGLNSLARSALLLS